MTPRNAMDSRAGLGDSCFARPQKINIGGLSPCGTDEQYLSLTSNESETLRGVQSQSCRPS